ncbi:MAG: hypothetical protein BGO69_18450 [Bacteroidetes bacterium 46-16]|nr:MAG: hypothetical protein BGO69_18450 [Bacteroidetes bacterium 46-16]
MKAVKNLLGHLYFIYGMILFVVTMLIVVIPIWLISLLPEPRCTRAIHVMFRGWMGVFMPLVFCPVIRRGKKNFRKGENYVVVTNHNSLVDVPVSSPWIPGANKTLAKVEMARIPVFGLIYKSGSVLVDRKKENSRRESFAKMQEMLNMGLHLCLYPEGTRNKTGKPLQPFYDGAFITAIKAQKDIIPGIIFNTGRILPHNKKLWARPLPIYFDFLEPISTKNLTLDNLTELKEKVHNIMEDYYVKNLSKYS